MAWLEVLRAGAGVTIQDAGRTGWQRYGVTPSGPMDWVAFETAAQVLGNKPDAAALEISIGGIDVTAREGAVDLAFCGGGFAWARDGKALPPAMRLRLSPGERLSVRPGPWGSWAYLAVAGGIDTPVEMGSRSTHLRSGIGGRMIQAGDRLSVLGSGRSAKEGDGRLDAPWLQPESNPIRVLLGPQDDYFEPAALETLASSLFTLTPVADRMAYRFAGPKLAHTQGFNIVSDGIALGAVQVGGDGEPLVLMADHQPTGGYPKIGYVIRADIGRLAQMRPGETCRFSICDIAEARAALFKALEKIAAVRCMPHPTAVISSELLRQLDLIDGISSAPQPDY